jgi:hypothetical protein
MSCIVCGKKRKLKTVKMPKGTFDVCSFGKCHKKLVLNLLGYFPIAGFSLGELTDSEIFTEEEMAAMPLTDEDEIDLAEYQADAVWNDDSTGNIFREALNGTAQEAERLSLSRIPRKDLPLKIGNLKYPENASELERVLKQKR